MHNSVTINNEEINPLNKNVFYVDWKTNFTCENWSISSDEIIFVGKHDAFKERFGVIIRRTVSYNPKESSWSIIDEIVGDKLSSQNITSNWIMAPDINFQYNRSEDTWSNANNIYLEFKNCNNVTVTPVDYSPQYGVLLSSLAFSATLNEKNDDKCKSEIFFFKK